MLLVLEIKITSIRDKMADSINTKLKRLYINTKWRKLGINITERTKIYSKCRIVAYNILRKKHIKEYNLILKNVINRRIKEIESYNKFVNEYGGENGK